MELLDAVAVALWTMLPAYVPNNAAVLFGGGRPIDGGRTWGGRRLLGDGKTWRGTATGIVVGAVVALALDALAPGARSLTGLPVPGFTLAVVLALPAGAMLGDMAASFVKRRMDRERGAMVPGLDQLDFLVGALVLAAIADFAWFTETFVEEPITIVVVLVMTPVLHVTTNWLAYKLGLKSVPW